MGWLDIFKRKEEDVIPPVKSQDIELEKPVAAPPLLQKVRVYAFLLSGKYVQYEALCQDRDAAKIAARAWAETVEDAYYYKFYFDGEWERAGHGHVGGRFPWSYTDGSFKRYHGVVPAKTRAEAFEQIKPKLREALGVSHLGRITLCIADDVGEYVDYLESTLP